MPEEINMLAFIAMVAAMMVNIVCAINHIKSKKFCEKYWRELADCLFEEKTRFWNRLGAYDAENGRMYIDLEGGLRLVIFEGEIDGWYMR